MKSGMVAGVMALLLVVCVLAACAVGVVVFPSQTAEIVAPVSPGLAKMIAPAEATPAANDDATALEATFDADLSTQGEEEEYREAHKGRPKVYPLVAQCDGVDLRTPIAPADLTGVLFHQASYEYALVLDTILPIANIEAIGPETPARINREQLDGDWLDGEAMHIWRTTDATYMDTSIDIGAVAGTSFRSPVSGTVVLLKDYKLYEELPDVEIHIRPDDRPDLDVVLIHTEGALVNVSDHVQAGVTELSHVRDIAAALSDVQLGFYTAGDDPGNHVHVQVNNANYPGYREKKLEGAIA